MSDKKYEFTGQVTNIKFFDNKFYITVEKRLYDAHSEPGRLLKIDIGGKFWTTNLRDIYNAYSSFITKEERMFVIPRDQMEHCWSLPEE